MEVYNNPAEYKGKEWDELLRAMNARDIKRTLKSAYRSVGNKVADVARQALASSGLRNGGKMKRSVRVRVYPRGSGFMVTVKPHGRQGYYRRQQDGKEKPVAMWAQEGTKERYARHGKAVFPVGQGQFRTMRGNLTGRMPAYNFLEAAERLGPDIIENDLKHEIEKSVKDRAAKLGWT